MGLVVGIDTGGTFTDMVVLEPATGLISALKTSSTPHSPGQAILDAGKVAWARHFAAAGTRTSPMESVSIR